jgi:RNA polymerase subunit RPABC4/transcription elongation factor Spt4
LTLSNKKTTNNSHENLKQEITNTNSSLSPTFYRIAQSNDISQNHSGVQVIKDTTKICPYCQEAIPAVVHWCPNCSSAL